MHYDPDALCPTCRRKGARGNSLGVHIGGKMHEKICIVKHSHGLKRRPKVMTAIGRTHPTSGTRHTTNFSLKKKRYECSVLLFYQRESHLTTAFVLQLALLPRFSLLIVTQPKSGERGGDLPIVGLLNCGPT